MYITTVLSCHVWPLYSTSQKFRTASHSLEWESVSKLLTGAVYIFAVQRQFLNWRSNWVFGWREAKVHPAVLIAETKPDPLSSTAKSDTESDRLSDLLFRLEVLHFRSWTTDSQPCFFKKIFFRLSFWFQVHIVIFRHLTGISTLATFTP